MSTIEQPALVSQPRPYGWSVLASACVRWWRGTVVLLLVIIINAAIQAALIAASPASGTSPLAALLALVSGIALLVAASVVVTTALLTAAGRVGVKVAFAKTRAHFWLFCLWSIAWLIVVTVGLMLHTWPGVLIAAVTPFVGIAAADGRRNALGANFRAIGSRFGRYFVTLIISGVILLVFHLLATANGFFIGGTAAAFILWTCLGLVGTWLVVGWSLLYRATKVGQVPFESITDAAPSAIE